MTAPMDRDTADLIVAELAGLWSTPMDDLELERWRRVLRPADGEPLDPELAGQALLHFRHASAGRPTISLFRAMYDAMATRSTDAGLVERSRCGRLPTEDVEPPTERSAALEHIAGLRLSLAGDGQAAQVLPMAGQS